MAAQTPELQSFYLQAQFDRNISESVQFSEAVGILFIEIEESVALSETTDSVATRRLGTGETILISEQVEAKEPLKTPILSSFYLQAQFDRNISESVQFSEETEVLFRVAEEALLFFEDLSLSVIHSRYPDETVIFSEEIEAKKVARTPVLLSFWLHSTGKDLNQTIYFSEEIEIEITGPSFISISETVSIFEEYEPVRASNISEEVLLSEVFEIVTFEKIIEENFYFSEEPLFEIFKSIQEFITLSEEFQSNSYAFEEPIKLEEVILKVETLRIGEALNLQEELRLQVLKLLDEEIVFTEEIDWELNLSSESIDLSEVIYQNRLSLDETLDLTAQVVNQIVKNLSESFNLEEQVVRQVEISETVFLEEAFWDNHRGISESFQFSEGLELRTLGIKVLDQIFFSEKVEWEWKFAPESVVVSEVIYQNRLGLDEEFGLIEATPVEIAINLSEFFNLEEKVARQTEIHEIIRLAEEIESNYRALDEEVALLETLTLEIYIWIPKVTEIQIQEGFVFYEEIESKVQPGRIVFESVQFSEEVELTRRVQILAPGGGVDRGVVAAPKPIEVVSYPTAKAPPVVKRAYPRAEPVPIEKKAYPLAKPVPLPRRIAPTAVPRVLVMAPAPRKVLVTRRKKRMVRMTITDNSSRYRVK